MDAYGIPASPWQLARDVDIAASKETDSSQSASVGVLKRPAASSAQSAPGGEFQDAELVGHSASSAFADLGSDSHAQHPASVATGSGIRRHRVRGKTTQGERAALPLASGEHVEQGEGASRGTTAPVVSQRVYW